MPGVPLQPLRRPPLSRLAVHWRTRSILTAVATSVTLALGAGPAAAEPAQVARAASEAARAAAAPPGAARLGPELPLRREDTGGPSMARSLALSATMLGLLAAVLLRRRRRAPRAPSTGALPRPSWLRRLAVVPANRPLEVLHSTRLTTRATVHVLRWDDEEWLVGCADQGVTLLGRRAAAADPATESDVEPRPTSLAAAGAVRATEEPA